jgi:hypothetical protein
MNHIQNTKIVNEKKQFSFAEAREIGDALGIRWDKFDIEQFTMGLNVELEHGRRDPETDVTHDEPMVTGKIALAHLKEIPDYYARLAEMEYEAGQTKRMQRRVYLQEMRSTKRNTLHIVLAAVTFIVMIILEVRQAKTMPTSTTVGLDHY